MKKILFSIITCICIHGYAVGQTTEKIVMKYNLYQFALTDANLQPIERTTKVQQQSGEIHILKDEIRIYMGQNKTYQRFVITKHRKLGDRWEFGATSDGGHWALSLARTGGKNCFMAIWAEEQTIMVFNITQGFTLNIPFLK